VSTSALTSALPSSIRIVVCKLIYASATHEFDELCFDYGIELDEDVSREGLDLQVGVVRLINRQTTKEVEEAKAKGLPTPPPQLKIEIPANRFVRRLEGRRHG
jgi:phenylalanyl-tRNA synthetase beta chain